MMMFKANEPVKLVPTNIAAGDYEVKLVTKPGIERYEKTIFSGIITITE